MSFQKEKNWWERWKKKVDEFFFSTQKCSGTFLGQLSFFRRLGISYLSFFFPTFSSIFLFLWKLIYFYFLPFFFPVDIYEYPVKNNMYSLGGFLGKKPRPSEKSRKYKSLGTIFFREKRNEISEPKIISECRSVPPPHFSPQHLTTPRLCRPRVSDIPPLGGCDTS